MRPDSSLLPSGLLPFGENLTSEIVASIVGALVPVVLAVVVPWYLYRPNVKAAFGRA